VQRRERPGDLLGLHPGDAAAATWELAATATPGPAGADVRGPYIQGRPGGRFIYLSWGTVDEAGTFTMFRRAKLRLDAVSPQVLRGAQEQGCLVARVILTDPKGNPTCASVGPPFIEWSAAPA
jgi:hypothetical protein